MRVGLSLGQNPGCKHHDSDFRQLGRLKSKTDQRQTDPSPGSVDIRTPKSCTNQ